MKQVAILFLAAQIACGSSDEDSSPPPEVTRVNVEHGFCGSSIGCSVFVSAAYNSGATVAPSGYSLMVSIAEGVDPPAACDGSSVNGGSTYASFDKLKASTAYAFRACVFNNVAGTYTPGAIVVYTTQAPS